MQYRHMEPVKDFTTDNGLAFLDILNGAGAIPPWLQSIPDAGDVAKLPSTAFADSANRMLPIHSKAAAYMSAVHSYVHDYPGTGWQERLKSACHAYKITDAVKLAIDLLKPEEVKQASDVAEDVPNVKYAMELVVEPGTPPVGYYPINNAAQIEDSAIKMAADFEQARLPASWFCEGAIGLMKAAKDHGVSEYLIPRSVRELGEERAMSVEYLEDQIAKRAAAGVGEAGVALYREAVESVVEGTMSQMDGAHFWELSDLSNGIKYAGVIRPPHVAFLSGRPMDHLRKEASALVQVNSILVPHVRFRDLPDRLIAAMFEKEAAVAILSAKDCEDGVDATQKLASLSEDVQVDLLKLIVDSVDGGDSRAA